VSAAKTDRAVVVTGHGGLEVLELQELPSAPVGAGEVAVRVTAAGVNFADVLVRMGVYPGAPELPFVPGLEVAGVVEELGSGVGGWEVGQRVMCGMRYWGGHRERVVVPAAHLIPLGPRLSDAQATAIPVNYSTAWSALVEYGALQRGQRVLVHAAAGGVGTAALQIAKLHGAEVWGTASPGKHALLEELGIDQAIDYTQDGWSEGLPDFDLVLDGVGGQSLKTSYDLLCTGGRLIAIGSASIVSGDLKSARFNALRMMTDSKSVIGLNGLKLWQDLGMLERWTGPLYPLLTDGSLQPVVGLELPLDRVGEAHTALAGRRTVGKVVLQP
jgi:NADPH:quinone reductase-like Zn-dependent oxidoreductase